jgi:Chromo (CHRromatin Organisation MOdifier) domain
MVQAAKKSGKSALLAATDEQFRRELLEASEALTGLQPGADGDGMYLVKDITKRKTTKDGTFLYYIKWLGWDDSDDSWEPFENLNQFAKDYCINRWCCGGKTPPSIIGQYDEVLLEHYLATVAASRAEHELRVQAKQSATKTARANKRRRSSKR